MMGQIGGNLRMLASLMLSAVLAVAAPGSVESLQVFIAPFIP
ncbi:hypothetical protein [Rhodanobacter lindaniclasticus]|nr:hypothetical protein [Rhodanobacter lindaniclasticus]